jgi:hypothetical protein
MLIYISGKIIGLPFPEVKTKFQEMQDFLEDLDFEVVNPTKNGLTESHPWKQHIARDVELLLPCDAIYMFDGWQDSVGACIEYDIAMRTGKDIWFESRVVKSQSVVLKIQNAIHEVMGMKFCQYTTKSRKRDGFFARMIFVHHCNVNDVDPRQYIRRDRTMIYYYLNQYNDEMKYNPRFKKIAKKVEDKLNSKTKEDGKA